MPHSPNDSSNLSAAARPASRLACLAVCGAVSLVLVTDAFAGPPTIIQLSAILASKNRQPFDPRLVSLKPQLRGLPYKGYTLLGSQMCRSGIGGHCGIDIPGGGFVVVTTKESNAHHMRLHLLLNYQNRPVLSTELTLNGNAGLLVRGMRTDQGTIIISVLADRPKTAPARSPQAQPSE